MSTAISHKWKQFYRGIIMTSKPSPKSTAYWWKNVKNRKFQGQLQSIKHYHVQRLTDFSQQRREIVVVYNSHSTYIETWRD